MRFVRFAKQIARDPFPGRVSLCEVRRTGKCDCSTRRMISSFSDSDEGCLIRGLPHPRACFFEQSQFDEQSALIGLEAFLGSAKRHNHRDQSEPRQEREFWARRPRVEIAAARNGIFGCRDRATESRCMGHPSVQHNDLDGLTDAKRLARKSAALDVKRPMA